MRLDLNEHDPEDFFGKTVLWQNVEFVVGRHIATGADVIVHRLINSCTGDFGFVIKIRRDPSFRGGIPQPEDGQYHLHSVYILITAMIDLPGGKADIQPHLQTGRFGHPDLVAKMEQAHEFFAAGRISDAIAVYRDLRAAFPEEPEVLFNLAAALTQERRYDEAYLLLGEVVRIDPLDLTARIACFRCAQLLGPLDLCERALHECIEQFPMAEEPRSLGIDMYLNAGRPESAVRLLATNSALFRTRYGDIVDAFEKKRKAWKALHAAMQTLPEDDKLSSTQLESALATYEKDPLISINLALALRREGRYEEAASLLRRNASGVRIGVARACLLNAGFCEALAGRRAEADSLFDTAIGFYDPGPDGTINAVDMNNLANWVEEVGDTHRVVAWLEEPPAAGLRFLQSMGDAPPGSGREQLMRLYAEAERTMSAGAE